MSWSSAILIRSYGRVRRFDACQWVRALFGPLCRLVGEFLWMKYHTRLQWRRNSCATKRTGWVGWIAQAAYIALRGLPWGTEWYTHWVCYPVCQRPIPETHTRYHANHACTKQDTRSTIILCIKQRGVCLSWRLLVLSCFNTTNNQFHWKNKLVVLTTEWSQSCWKRVGYERFFFWY